MFSTVTLPTPLSRWGEFSGARVELWLKNDGLSHAVYGGNKVRKALSFIAEAKQRQAKRVLTVGAVGSHHVLTTALFAKAARLGCAAVLIPQPATAHVVDTIRASLAQGVTPYPAASWQVPFALLAAWQKGDYFVPPGGSNLLGALAYVAAVAELKQQLREQELEPPDWIVVPVGSGGTCAGIAAGLIQHKLPSRVLGVAVIPGAAAPWVTRRLARRVLRSLSLPTGELAHTLQFDREQAGTGYGVATAAGAQASSAALAHGLELDSTYTAKAFAGVLALLEREQGHTASSRPRSVLYWHTLAATPLGELLTGAPAESQLPAGIRRLLL